MSKKIIYLPLLLLIISLAWGEDCKEEKVLHGKKTQEKSEIIDLGKEKLIYGKDIVEVKILMQRVGQTLYFRKSGDGLTIDSTIYPDGSYRVEEIYRDKQRGIFTRNREISGKQTFWVFDNNKKLIQWYSIGEDKEQLYDEKNELLHIFKEVRGDTVFYDVEGYNQWDGRVQFIN